MTSSTALQEIETLDPIADHQRIMLLTCRVDFPFDTTRALEFALFRTFCVPTIAALLDKTHEFGDRAQRRYDDTDIIVSHLIELGYDSPRGRAAIKQMNEIHGRFDISNDDFLYVLSTFVFEPARWIGRFGWRPLIEKERLAMFYFWREVGRRMNIKDLPESSEALEQFNREYERTRYRYTPANANVGNATIRMFASWMPAPLRPLTPVAMRALLDPPLLEAFDFKPAPAWVRQGVERAVRLRSRLAHTLVRRKEPLLRTSMKPRSYPEGYDVTKIGPAKCPFRS
jgi:hypothetical protein